MPRALAGNRTVRLLLALLIAPLAPAFVLLPFSLTTLSATAPVLLWGTLLVSYPVAILFGLPTHFALLHARFTRFATYWRTGAFVGAVIACLMAAAQLNGALINGVLGSWLGFVISLAGATLVVITMFAAAASAFWLVARPDKGLSPGEA